MMYLFLILMLVSPFLLIVGMISPRLISKLLKRRLTRGKIAVLFTGMFIVSLVLFYVTAPKEGEKIQQPKYAAAVSTPIIVKTVQPSEVPQTPSPNPTRTPEGILRGVTHKYIGDPNENSVDIEKDGDKWSVIYRRTTGNDFMMNESAKAVTHDLIFDVYASGVPIKRAAIVIINPIQGKHFRASLCDDMASLWPQDTWSKKDQIGNSVFFDFLKSHTNGTSMDETGCATYVESNME